MLALVLALVLALILALMLALMLALLVTAPLQAAGVLVLLQACIGLDR